MLPAPSYASPCEKASPPGTASLSGLIEASLTKTPLEVSLTVMFCHCEFGITDPGPPPARLNWTCAADAGDAVSTTAVTASATVPTIAPNFLIDTHPQD